MALVLGLVALCYGAALSSLPGPTGDNAELQYLGRVMGVSHPTGYPLYLLATHAFQWVFPFGTPAFQINAFSLLCALTALGALAGIARQFHLSGWAMVPALPWVAATPAWLRLGTVAEVYAFHCALSFLTMLCFLHWSTTRKSALLGAGIFLHALSYGNHLTTLLLLPGLVFLVWKTERSTFRDRRTLAWVLFSILTGAALYSYVLLRSDAAPDADVYQRVTSLRELWAYVSGAQFRQVMGSAPPAGEWSHARNILALFAREWSWTALPAAFGLGVMIRRSPVYATALLLVACAQGFMIWFYRIPDIADYLMPLGGIVALGLASALDRAAREWSALRRPGRAALVACALAVLIPAFAQAARRVRAQVLAPPQSADAGSLRAVADAAREPTLLIVPHWQQLAITRYYIRGEGRSNGNLDARIWLPGETAAYAPSELKTAFAELRGQYAHVLVYGRAEVPLYDLVTPLRAAGIPLQPLTDRLVRLLPAPAP